VKEVGSDGKPPWNKPLAQSFPGIRNREVQVALVLTLVIGALTGMAVVAFIVVTEHLGMRLYPVGSAAWRRLLVPVLGSVGMGYPMYGISPMPR
jgi:CIC family chloride channel protein